MPSSLPPSPEPTQSEVVSAPSSFDSELVQLCCDLEEWRREQKTALTDDPGAAPLFNWKSGIWAVGYYAAHWASIRFFDSHTKSVGTLDAWGVVWICASIVAAAVAFVFLLRAFGATDKRYWREVGSLFSNKDNYPFSSVHRGLKRDLQSCVIFKNYSTRTLVAGFERIGLEESDFKERLNALVGNPSFLALIALATTVWTYWRNFHGESGIGSTAVLGGSLLAFSFAIYGARLRFSLFELTHCRLLLCLEIARRKQAPADNKSAPSDSRN